MRNASGYLQQIGRALMTPISVLPAAGLLLRFGDKDLLNIPLIRNAGHALFSDLPVIFAAAVGLGLAGGDRVAGLAGLTGCLVMSHEARLERRKEVGGVGHHGASGVCICLCGSHPFRDTLPVCGALLRGPEHPRREARLHFLRRLHRLRAQLGPGHPAMAHHPGGRSAPSTWLPRGGIRWRRSRRTLIPPRELPRQGSTSQRTRPSPGRGRRVTAGQRRFWPLSAVQRTCGTSTPASPGCASRHGTRPRWTWNG